MKFKPFNELSKDGDSLDIFGDKADSVKLLMIGIDGEPPSANAVVAVRRYRMVMELP